MIYALGAFDGFHIGHQQLLHTAAKRAGRTGAGWGVMTFDSHPQQLFKEGFKLLFMPEERDMLVRYFDIPSIEKIAFTHTFADMLPAEFVDYISKRDEVNGLVVGENFRFGRARIGTPELLSSLCRERGWSLDVVPSYVLDDKVVSSTLIRESLLRGQAENACVLLGHPFLIHGRVVKGDMRGRELGYPTANIAVHSGKIYPCRGSYASLAFAGGKWYPTALNIGYNPTFEGKRALRCEAHIIGWEGDIYGDVLTVFVIARNRDEIKFPSSGALTAQLQKDTSRVQSMSLAYLSRFTERMRKFEKILL